MNGLHGFYEEACSCIPFKSYWVKPWMDMANILKKTDIESLQQMLNASRNEDPALLYLYHKLEKDLQAISQVSSGYARKGKWILK